MFEKGPSFGWVALLRLFIAIARTVAWVWAVLEFILDLLDL
jgi:hypothetical protein